MFKVDIKSRHEWDEDKEQFVNYSPIKLSFEHSLISISKWESKWHKPFLSENEKSLEETLDYIRCCCVDKEITLDDVKALPQSVITDFEEYIKDPMTATTFQDRRQAINRGLKQKEIVTSEQIYYWMIAYNIPDRFEKWHLNRLMNLIKICGLEAEKQNPKSKNKMSKKDIYAYNKQLNDARRKQWNTKG